MYRRALTRQEKAYLYAFWATLFVAWSPFKLLAFLVPYLSLGLLIVTVGSRRFYIGMLLRMAVFVFVYVLLLGVWLIATPGFNLISALLAILTYGPLVFAWLVPSGALHVSDVLLEKMGSIVRIFVLIEGTLGVLQAFYGYFHTGTFDLANGDWVKGTIGFSLNGFVKGVDFSNAMFAVNVAFSLLFLVATWQVMQHRLLTWIAALVGAVALIFASVMHVIVFLGLALIVSAVLYGGLLKLQRVFRLGVLIAILTAGVFYFLPTNLTLINSYLGQFMRGESPRAVMVRRLLDDIPSDNPWVLYLGTGPGQLTSRAALIVTGMYFGSPLNPKPIPFIPTGTTDLQKKYFLDLWIESASNPYYGSTQKPYSSWISMVAECGVIITVFVIYMLIFRMYTTYKLRVENWHVAFIYSSGLLFLFLLGAQENYWEVAQAVFPGIMMLKVLFGRLIGAKSERKVVVPTHVLE